MSRRRPFLASQAAWLIVLCAASTLAQTQTGGGGQRPAEGRTWAREGICLTSKSLDFTGDYTGLLALDDGPSKGKRATLTVHGNEFDLISNALTSSGYITAVNSCGYTSITLRFTHAEGNQDVVRQLLSSSISLDARRPGTNKVLKNFFSLKTREALVLSTVSTLTGKPAGAQFLFQKCPDPPCSQEDYPECPRCVK